MALCIAHASSETPSVPTRLLGQIILGLFLISGFAGLIYQSIWTHYLGLLLGHAAYAQTLVLAIFMGGMAGGAWLAARYSRQLSRLVLAYAIAEALIGLFGLAFHSVFVAYADFTRLQALPALGAGALADSYQWLTAALLILPQCLLLGATFPLLSAGYLRLAPAHDAHILGGLYFSNSFGAALGALAATFVLLPRMGMPGAMLTAGLLNIAVAAAAWLLARRTPVTPAPVEPPPAANRPAASAGAADAARGLTRLLLLATAISGAFSFVYEIGWIRLLNQVLGTSLHSFELMLAAFILGLAFGGLWVRHRVRRTDRALRLAAGAQIAMGVAAMLSIAVFGQSFDWVAWMMGALERSSGGYAIFSIGSAVVAILVMFPAAFFAGMTLPLFTTALLRAGAGERSIGGIYAANTLGSILGVLLAVHVLIPLIGVRLAVLLAASGDFLLGLYLLKYCEGTAAPRRFALAGIVGAAALLIATQWGAISPRQQASGVFRYAQATLEADAEVHYLRDGKTATVAVTTHGDGRYGRIATNGKPDAMLSTRLDFTPSTDEETMLMLGALPLLHHRAPSDIGVIGWGSGLTVHTLLGSSLPSSVVSVEIERAMYEGAKLFGERVERAYADPRSQLVVNDARKHFASLHTPFDVIVSEPSNPWVSGVSQLFTQEFYEFLARQLSDDGVLVQWLHVYELSDALLAQMVHALLKAFPHVEAYAASYADMVLVASKRPLPPINTTPLSGPQLQAEMERVGLLTAEDFALRWLGDDRLLRTYVRAQGARPYSDYYPTVALDAPRQRFMRSHADWLSSLSQSSLNVRNMVLGFVPPPLNARLTAPQSAVPSHARRLRALATIDAIDDHSTAATALPNDLYAAVQRLRQYRAHGVEQSELIAWGNSLAVITHELFGQVPPRALAAALEQLTPPSALAPALSFRVLAALRAAAIEDLATLRELGPETLSEHPSLPASLNEQLLVLSMAAMAAGGLGEEARALEDAYGSREISTARYNSARHFLLNWRAQAGPQAVGAVGRTAYP